MDEKLAMTVAQETKFKRSIDIMLSVKVDLVVLFGAFDLVWSTRQTMGAKTEVEDATYYASFVTLPFKGLIEFAMYRSTKQKKFLKELCKKWSNMLVP